MRPIDLIAEAIGDYCIKNNIISIGQNLLKPSYISGIGKHLVGDDGITPVIKGSFDTTNSELTTVGYCIGRMIEGHDTVHIVKQQDFLYLAIDQFINTLCNNIDIKQKDLGTYTLICMISDWPYEGVQARSNNIELFASMENFLAISYCHCPHTFKSKLNEHHHGSRILFLSSEKTYHNINALGEVPAKNTNAISISLNDSKPLVHLLVGFIPNKILEAQDEKNYISIININSRSLIEEIVNAIEKKWLDRNVTIIIHEASTSKICLSYEIAWKLKELNSFLDIKVNNLQVGSNSNMALIDQSKW